MRFEIKPANELSFLPLAFPLGADFNCGKREGMTAHWFCFHVNASLCLGGDFGCRSAGSGGGGSCKSF